MKDKYFFIDLSLPKFRIISNEFFISSILLFWLIILLILIFNVYTESLNLWDSQLFIILFRWYKGWEIMLGFKKIFLSIQLSRLLKVSLKWQIIFSENGITDFSYFKIFLYHHTMSEGDISYLDYLGIPSCYLGEGQHWWCC